MAFNRERLFGRGCTLIFLVAFWISSTGAQRQIRVHLDSLRALQLEYTLPQLVGHLEAQIGLIDRPQMVKRRYEIIETHEKYLTAKQDIVDLAQTRDNLRAIYEFSRKLANSSGEITDVELLRSHNSYLKSKTAVRAKESEARSHLLNIAELCHLEILLPEKVRKNELQEEAAITGSD